MGKFPFVSNTVEMIMNTKDISKISHSKEFLLQYGKRNKKTGVIYK